MVVPLAGEETAQAVRTAVQRTLDTMFRVVCFARVPRITHLARQD
jgi:hypothetical protein